MKTTKPQQRKAKTATSMPKARNAKQLAADQEKAERLLAREVKQKDSDNRFTPLWLIRAIERSFGKINFDPCWHAASAVRPNKYLDARQGHNCLRDEWSGRLAFVNGSWSLSEKQRLTCLCAARRYMAWTPTTDGLIMCDDREAAIAVQDDPG